MAIVLTNTLGGSTKEGIKMNTDVEFYRDSTNILRTPDNVQVDTDIYQDDIVYPYLTQSAVTGVTTLSIKSRKFDGSDSANNYHHIHWWIGTSSMGAPATLTSYGSGLTLAMTAGVKTSGTTLPLTISSTNTGLQTALTNSNETITLTVTATDGGTGSFSTGYLMAEVQGILYSVSFSYDNSL